MKILFILLICFIFIGCVTSVIVSLHYWDEPMTLHKTLVHNEYPYILIGISYIGLLIIKIIKKD